MKGENVRLGWTWTKASAISSLLSFGTDERWRRMKRGVGATVWVWHSSGLPMVTLPNLLLQLQWNKWPFLSLMLARGSRTEAKWPSLAWRRNGVHLSPFSALFILYSAFWPFVCFLLPPFPSLLSTHHPVPFSSLPPFSPSHILFLSSFFLGSPCSWGWLWTSYPLTSSTLYLALQTHTLSSVLRITEDLAQDSVHSTHALGHMNLDHSFINIFCVEKWTFEFFVYLLANILPYSERGFDRVFEYTILSICDKVLYVCIWPLVSCGCCSKLFISTTANYIWTRDIAEP